MSKWCSHTFKNDGDWFMKHGESQIYLGRKWNFCPLCGTKKPEEPKILSKIIDDEIWACGRKGMSINGHGRGMALVALKWFRKNLPQESRNWSRTTADIYDEIDEWIDKEIKKCK